MQASIFLAKLIGPVFVVVAIALFANRQAMRDMTEEFLASRALLFLTGLLTMPAGLAIVLTHNVWTADWRVLITLFGWFTAIGGALRLISPQLAVRAGRRFLRHPQAQLVAGVVWLIIGLVLCFYGYRR